MSLACHSGKRWRRGSCAVCCAMWVNHACKPESSPRRRLGERHTSFEYKMRHAAARVPFSSLLVQRDQWNTYWGGEKIIFLIRDIDGPAMTAASMESCRFVGRRSPWGRLGSAVVACKRLHRMRQRFKHFWPISLSSPHVFSSNRPRFASRAPREH